MDTTFQPPVFRFTVRTPEARYGRIREAARAAGLTTGQLVQALFDRLDLTDADGVVRDALKHFHETCRAIEPTKAMARRAAACGLTVKELKVFRALAERAGDARIVRPAAIDIAPRAMVPEDELESVYDRLTEKGFLAIAPGTGRGRRAYRIARIPEL